MPHVSRYLIPSERKFESSNARCDEAFYASGTCDPQSIEETACPQSVVPMAGIPSFKMISLPMVYQDREVCQDFDEFGVNGNFDEALQYCYHLAPQSGVPTAVDWCREACYGDNNCQGFQLSQLEVVSDWLTCTLWKDGACLNDASPGFEDGLWPVNGAYFPAEVQRTRSISGMISFLWQNKSGLGQYFYLSSLLLSLSCMVCAAAIVSTVQMFWNKHPYGTLQFLQEVVKKKKSSVWKGFSTLATFACFMNFAVIVYLCIKELASPELLLAPLLAMVNVVDLQRFNRDLHPDDLSSIIPVYLELPRYFFVMTSEQLLEMVENGVLAHYFARNDEPFRQIFKNVDGQLVENIMDIYTRFGVGMEPKKGSYLPCLADMPLGLLAKVLNGIVQSKAYIAVGAAGWVMVNTGFSFFYAVVQAPIPAFDKTYGFQMGFHVLIACFVLSYPYVLVLDNPFPYGSFQYFQKVVSTKKKFTLFKRFFPISMGIAGFMLAIALAFSNGCELVLLNRMGLSLFMLVVNAIHTVKFTQDYYPSPYTTDIVFLKLTMFDHAAASAEQILDRVENAFIAWKLTDNPEHLDGLIRNEDRDSMVAIMSHIGTVDNLNMDYEKLIKYMKYMLLGGFLILLCWQEVWASWETKWFLRVLELLIICRFRRRLTVQTSQQIPAEEPLLA